MNAETIQAEPPKTPARVSRKAVVVALRRYRDFLMKMSGHTLADIYNAHDAAAKAISEAAWGAHGNLFITDQAVQVGGSERIREVYVQRRHVASLREGVVTLTPPDISERGFEKAKHWQRFVAERYLATRATLAHNIATAARDEALDETTEAFSQAWEAKCERIAKALGNYQYVPGQNGGCFITPFEERVSAMGALRAARALAAW